MGEGEDVSLTCLEPLKGGPNTPGSAVGIGLDPQDLKGHSLVILGRGASRPLRATLEVIKSAQVPALLLSEDEADILSIAGESAGVPILIAGGPIPGLGLLLLGQLLKSGAPGLEGELVYSIDGLSPYWAEYLRSAFGRGRVSTGGGALSGGMTGGMSGGMTGGVTGGGSPIASGEVGAFGAFGADIGQGHTPSFPLSARVRSPSRRLALGLRALDTPPGRTLLGTPGRIPSPDAFLTGQGGRLLGAIAPEGTGGRIDITLRSRYRSQLASLSISDPQALAGKSVAVLARALLSWSAPIGISSPLTPTVFQGFEAAMAPVFAQNFTVADLPHSLDPRSARRFQILAP